MTGNVVWALRLFLMGTACFAAAGFLIWQAVGEGNLPLGTGLGTGAGGLLGGALLWWLGLRALKRRNQ